MTDSPLRIAADDPIAEDVRQLVETHLPFARRVTPPDDVHAVGIETGTMDAFAASRALYIGAGFEPCEPFGEHREGPNSICMTFHLA